MLAQRTQVPTLPEKGAEAYRCSVDVWTSARITAVIEVRLGMRYHPAHVSRPVRTP